MLFNYQFVQRGDRKWRKIDINKKTYTNSEISIFLKNRKQGVQTVRLDELNNIVTGVSVSFIFKN